MTDVLDTDASLVDSFAPNISAETDLAPADDSIINNSDLTDGAEPDLEAIRARVKEMEAEAEKLKVLQTDVVKQISSSPAANPTSPTATPTFPTNEERKEADARSIFVGNVDYGATAEELESHFHGIGSINRVTILCDKYTGHPKGFAYIEFADKEAVSAATAFDGSLFRARQLQISTKRTNQHGFGDRGRPRFRYRGRGRYRPYGGGRPRRYGGGRGRGRGHYYYPY